MCRADPAKKVNQSSKKMGAVGMEVDELERGSGIEDSANA